MARRCILCKEYPATVPDRESGDLLTDRVCGVCQRSAAKLDNPMTDAEIVDHMSVWFLVAEDVRQKYANSPAHAHSIAGMYEGLSRHCVKLFEEAG